MSKLKVMGFTRFTPQGLFFRSHWQAERPFCVDATMRAERDDDIPFNPHIFTSLRDGNRPHRIVGQPLVTANDVGH